MNGDDCGVSAELTEQVLRAQWQLRGQLRDSLRPGVTLGHLLQQAKGECRHGEWERWLKANYEGTSHHARRLVELSREYSNPNDVPAMSLREALRQLTKSQKADQDFAHERLSLGTIRELLDWTAMIEQAIDLKIIGALLLENLTPKHAAMKKAKAITNAIHRFAEHLRADFKAQDQADRGEPDSDDEMAIGEALTVLGLTWPCTEEAGSSKPTARAPAMPPGRRRHQ